MAGRDTSRSSAHASQRDSIDFTFYPAQVPRTEKFERKKNSTSDQCDWRQRMQIVRVHNFCTCCVMTAIQCVCVLNKIHKLAVVVNVN